MSFDSYDVTDASSHVKDVKRLSSNGLYWCPKCSGVVPFTSLAEHNALKHRVRSPPKSDADTAINRLPNGNWFTAIDDWELENKRMMERINKRDDESAGKENREPKPQLNNFDGGFRNSRQAFGDHNGRRMKRSKSLIVKSRMAGSKGSKGRQRSVSRQNNVQSVFELFDIHPSSDSELSDFNGDKPVVATVTRNVKPNQSAKLRLHANFQAKQNKGPVQRQQKEAKQISNDDSMCPTCKNIMPKNAIEAHIRRKHSEIGADPNFPNCVFCGNQMHEKAMANHVARMHSSAAKHQSKCKYCNQLMHSDYLPGHLLRKHKIVKDSIGTVHSKHTDEELNKMIRNGQVFVEKGALYITKPDSNDEDVSNLITFSMLSETTNWNSQSLALRHQDKSECHFQNCTKKTIQTYWAYKFKAAWASNQNSF